MTATNFVTISLVLGIAPPLSEALSPVAQEVFVLWKATFTVHWCYGNQIASEATAECKGKRWSLMVSQMLPGSKEREQYLVVIAYI